VDSASKQRFIRVKAAELQIRWSAHALNELASDKLSVADVEDALQDAIVIEDYPHSHRYLLDCLVLMFSHDGDAIHAVVALNETDDYILTVTVYRPNPKEWQDDRRTRK
jgi:hypothetical protein